MRGAASKLRNLLSGRTTAASASVPNNLFFLPLAKASISTVIRDDDWSRPPFMSAIVTTLPSKHFLTFGINHSLSFSSSTLHEIFSEEEIQIETVEQFNEHLRKIQDGLLPAIFYFPALNAPYGITYTNLRAYRSYPKRLYIINIAEESLRFVFNKIGYPKDCLYLYKHLLKHYPKFVMIETAVQYVESLRKVEDEKLAAIFYYTTYIVPDFLPNRLICPILERLSEKYPHVTIYKIDLVKVGWDDKEMNLRYLLCGYNLPVMIFYKNGERVGILADHLIKKKLQDIVEVYH